MNLFGKEFIKNNNIENLSLKSSNYNLIINLNNNIYNNNSILLNTIFEVKLIIKGEQINFNHMFENNSSLILISNFNIFEINITGTNYMFSGCSSLTILPFYLNFNISNNKDLSNIFNGCPSLKFLPEFSSNITNKNNLFTNRCNSLENSFEFDEMNTDKKSFFEDGFDENKNSEKFLNKEFNEKKTEDNIDYFNSSLSMIKGEFNVDLRSRCYKCLNSILLKIVILIILILGTLILYYYYKYDIIDDPQILKNEFWKSYQTRCGAYYFCYSPYIVGYFKITGYIILPKSLNTNRGGRNAYISPGVGGLYGAINCGIMNSGKGWLPFYYFRHNKTMVTFKEYYASYHTDIIGFEIEVTNSRIIIFSLTFRNSSLFILNSFKTEIDASDILVYENNEVKLRFYRFVNLAPEGKDDQNDGTYLIDGKFTELKIIRNNITYPWGISENDVEVSWLVSSKRIKVTHSKYEETFSIIHRRNAKFE